MSALFIKVAKGSYSIKEVLPSLYPHEEELDYHKLPVVHNGGEASDAFISLRGKTKEEQDAFFAEYRKHKIQYMKGVVFEVNFAKTYDNKFMVILKVCHLVLDMYGINNIYKDLFDVYVLIQCLKIYNS